MKNYELSLFDQVIATMYVDIWRSSPIFGISLRDPKPDARLKDDDLHADN